MIYEPISKGKSFYAIGLNYKKADADKRGRFSVQRNQIDFLLKDAKDQGVSSILVNSTCNRTEIYGFVSDARTLIALLCNHSEGTRKEFEDSGYVFKNAQAVDHIFNVGTGLDSQILGDFEIIAQLKKSFYRSKKISL